MEYTDEEDSFSVWMDSVDKHYPNARSNKELMILIMQTFRAGYIAGETGKDMGIITEAVG